MNGFVLILALTQLSPDTLSEQALPLASAGKLEEAERLWRSAVGMAPNHFASLFNLGYLSVQQNRHEEAAAWLRKAARAKPADFNTHYLLGASLSRLGRSDDALRAWRNALALQTANYKLMQVMCVEYSKGRYFDEAARLAEFALRGKPDDETFYYIGILAYRDGGNNEAAWGLARRALEKFPASARANFEAGFHLHKSGRWDEAMPYFEKAVAADSAYEEPYYFRGDVLLRRDQPEQAAEQFRLALARRAPYTAASLGLARALIAQDKLEEAIPELERAARQDLENPQPWLLLSQIWFRLGNAEAAKAAKQTAQRLRSANPGMLQVSQPRPFPAN